MDAEDTTPGFYTGNWLYLGKTYYQLSNSTEAKKWLQKLLDYTEQNEEDKEVGVACDVGVSSMSWYSIQYKEEATQLMRKL